ncbi:MAG: hypothetical protein O3A13_01320 [Proteobacteria bacterium]|nr:hypothetical protein [Pseudomonadota bacterium]MDA0992253.1 hypothetical protein [Pseudomonadota bacterium]
MRTILRPSGEQYFLKDAIRDLIVVIVGILAALYLEAWWQDRQDRAEEALLLEGLRAEFVANRSQLAEKISVWSGVYDAAKTAQQFMGKPLAEVDSSIVVPTMLATQWMQFYDPRTGQLDSLISSGKLGLIQDTKLRAMIADWPSLVEDLDIEREIALQAATTGFVYRLMEYISFPSENNAFEDRVDALLGDRRIFNDLMSTSGNMGRSIREGEIILHASDEIIAMIDSEIND